MTDRSKLESTAVDWPPEIPDDNRDEESTAGDMLTLWELLEDTPPWWTEIDRPEL